MLTALLLALQASSSPAPSLSLPIACVLGQSCEIQNYVDHDPGPGAADYRCGQQTYEAHSGVDFRLKDMRAQQAGVDVLAAADGQVLRVRDGVADVSVKTVGVDAVKGQECGNGLVIAHAGGLTTQYCHMAKGSIAVHPGQTVKAGERLGRVGLSGNTEYPHLHFTVRQGETLIDPFAPNAPAGSCSATNGLWRSDLKAALSYRPVAVLNAGFAATRVDMASIEAGPASPTADAQILVAYVRSIHLLSGDQQRLTLSGPGGEILARGAPAVETRAQAQGFLYIGKPRPASGWPKGRYEAIYQVLRHGQIAVERRWNMTF